MSTTPEHLRYTAEHEWVEQRGDVVRIGITDHAQDALGDIVFVTLPDVGRRVEAGQSFGEVESTKSVSDIYAPLTGTITARNDALDATPELVNSDPYGEGWMVELRPDGDLAEALGVPALLDADGYRALLG